MIISEKFLKGITRTAIFLCLCSLSFNALHPNPARTMIRSGSKEDPDAETPLSTEGQKYADLLSRSNQMMENILAGKEAAVYDLQFSSTLKEATDRAWFLSQFSSLRSLYGPPTAIKKNQWYFVEESIRGIPVVHSIKIMHYGKAKVQYLISVRADDLRKVIGFDLVAPDNSENQTGSDGPEYRSGTEEDENIEKPLETQTKQFAPLLAGANAFLDLIKAGDYKTAYNNYFSNDLKAQVSGQRFSEMHKKIIEYAGPMGAYKPNQWTFFIKKYQKNDVIVLRKIVEHKNGMINYTFSVFKTDLKKFVGFQFMPKAGPPTTRYFYKDKDGNEHDATTDDSTRSR